MLHLQALHRDPLHWPEPEVFRPERFLGESPGQAWRWLPFLNGPRSCVGQHFALLEAKIVLSLLTQRFDFTPEPGNSGAPAIASMCRSDQQGESACACVNGLESQRRVDHRRREHWIFDVRPFGVAVLQRMDEGFAIVEEGGRDHAQLQYLPVLRLAAQRQSWVRHIAGEQRRADDAGERGGIERIDDGARELPIEPQGLTRRRDRGCFAGAEDQ